jgi:hypothetical protein
MAVLTCPKPDADHAPGLERLTRIELRKSTDTRAGFWLLALVALAGVAIMFVALYVGDDVKNREDIFAASQVGVAVLLPVVGILAVTGEWSQRTALTTFALVPRRSRVLTAKLSAGVCLAVAAVAVGSLGSVLVAGVGELSGHLDGGWGVDNRMLASVTLMAVVGVVMGVAFGMAFLNSPLAIVLYFVIPTVWSALSGTISALDGVADWLDTARTTEPMYEPGITAREWARFGTSTALWVGVPLLAGWFRVLRTEVK